MKKWKKKNKIDELDWLQCLCNLNFLKKTFTCQSGKLRTEFTSLIAKSSNPRLLDMAFFARCKSLYYFLVSQRHCCSLYLREKGFVDIDRNLVLVSLDYWVTGLFEKYFKFQVNVLVILSVKGRIMAVNNLVITTVVEFWQKYAFVSFL